MPQPTLLSPSPSSSAILCVDDEVLILSSLKEQLRRRFGDRYLYETATCADEAWVVIDELCTEGIDLLVIVSDWLMPGIKGDEFLAQVYQRHPRIATVLLTGQADESAIARARQQAHIRACLSKPWCESELAAVIESALG
ncbi:response regulator [Sphaerotilus sp.]|uniref:response regulator n=1 Tax=Sphaerotilus sp. TaxID=2093942 RepID=UPI0025F07E26|nr:response regulator [Sphaerotilus sp.]